MVVWGLKARMKYSGSMRFTFCGDYSTTATELVERK